MDAVTTGHAASPPPSLRLGRRNVDSIEVQRSCLLALRYELFVERLLIVELEVFGFEDVDSPEVDLVVTGVDLNI